MSTTQQFETLLRETKAQLAIALSTIISQHQNPNITYTSLNHDIQQSLELLDPVNKFILSNSHSLPAQTIQSGRIALATLKNTIFEINSLLSPPPVFNIDEVLNDVVEEFVPVIRECGDGDEKNGIVKKESSPASFNQQSPSDNCDDDCSDDSKNLDINVTSGNRPSPGLEEKVQQIVQNPSPPLNNTIIINNNTYTITNHDEFDGKKHISQHKIDGLTDSFLCVLTFEQFCWLLSLFNEGHATQNQCVNGGCIESTQESINNTDGGESNVQTDQTITLPQWYKPNSLVNLTSLQNRLGDGVNQGNDKGVDNSQNTQKDENYQILFDKAAQNDKSDGGTGQNTDQYKDNFPPASSLISFFINQLSSKFTTATLNLVDSLITSDTILSTTLKSLSIQSIPNSSHTHTALHSHTPEITANSDTTYKSVVDDCIRPADSSTNCNDNTPTRNNDNGNNNKIKLDCYIYVCDVSKHFTSHISPCISLQPPIMFQNITNSIIVQLNHQNGLIYSDKWLQSQQFFECDKEDHAAGVGDLKVNDIDQITISTSLPVIRSDIRKDKKLEQIQQINDFLSSNNNPQPSFFTHNSSICHNTNHSLGAMQFPLYSFASVTMNNIINSNIILPLIDSSLHITTMKRCIVMGRCHQLRLHYIENSLFSISKQSTLALSIIVPILHSILFTKMVGKVLDNNKCDDNNESIFQYCQAMIDYHSDKIEPIIENSKNTVFVPFPLNPTIYRSYDNIKEAKNYINANNNNNNNNNNENIKNINNDNNDNNNGTNHYVQSVLQHYRSKSLTIYDFDALLQHKNMNNELKPTQTSTKINTNSQDDINNDNTLGNNLTTQEKDNTSTVTTQLHYIFLDEINQLNFNDIVDKLYQLMTLI